MKTRTPKKEVVSENNILLLCVLSRVKSVRSRSAWAQATLDWLEAKGRENYFHNLLTATHSMPPGSVTVSVVGAAHEFRISTLGQKILALKKPVWIRGRGWFRGVSDAGFIEADLSANA